MHNCVFVCVCVGGCVGVCVGVCVCVCVCSLDNFPQKTEIIFFFGNQISKWRSLEKSAIFDLLFNFF